MKLNPDRQARLVIEAILTIAVLSGAVFLRGESVWFAPVGVVALLAFYLRGTISEAVWRHVEAYKSGQSSPGEMTEALYEFLIRRRDRRRGVALADSAVEQAIVDLMPEVVRDDTDPTILRESKGFASQLMKHYCSVTGAPFRLSRGAFELDPSIKADIRRLRGLDSVPCRKKGSE